MLGDGLIDALMYNVYIYKSTTSNQVPTNWRSQTRPPAWPVCPTDYAHSAANTLGTHLISVALEKNLHRMWARALFFHQCRPPMNSSASGSTTPAPLALDAGLCSPSPAAVGGPFESLVGPFFIESPSKSSRSAGGLVRESWRARTRQLQPCGCAGQQHESGGENHCSWWCEHLTTAVRLGLVHSDG
jgi:hypothetical protein